MGCQRLGSGRTRDCLILERSGDKLIAMKNQSAVELGRLGGKVGGHARARSLSPERRSEIARKAVRARWSRRLDEDAKLDMTDRSNRYLRARHLATETGADVDIVEQVLFMQTLPQWERLARARRRSRLGRSSEVLS